MRDQSECDEGGGTEWPESMGRGYRMARVYEEGVQNGPSLWGGGTEWPESMRRGYRMARVYGEGVQNGPSL